MTDVVETEKAYILVIDDDPLLTRTLKRVLERVGYGVDTASDGHEGIRKAKSGFYHLVLCDVRMPGLDGLMTVRHIQDFQKKAGIGKSGFILITAYDYPDTRHQAYQLGVTDFFPKPFDLPQFLETIRHHVTTSVEKNPVADVVKFNERLTRLLHCLHPDESHEQGAR